MKESSISGIKPTVLLFSLLYFLQGTIRGFVTIALSVFLIEQGISHASVAGLVAVFFLPWSFKLIWGPLVDSLRRRNSHWQSRLILLTQIGCASSLMILSNFNVESSSLTSISVLIFTVSIFVSLQDVAADSLAINSLDVAELTIVNSGMRFGRFLGVGLGSIGSAAGLSCFGFSTTVNLLVVVVSCITVASYKLLAFEGVQDFSDLGNDRTNIDIWQTVKSSVLELTKWPAAQVLLFGFFVSVGDSIIEFSIKPLYVDDLGWTAFRFSTYDSVSSFLKAGGAILAATFAIRSASPVLLTVSGLAIASVLSIMLGCSAKLDPRIPVTYILVSPLVASIGWVGFLSLAMQHSRSDFAATKFAIFMAACNLGTFLGVLVIGPIRNLMSFGYSGMIIIGGLLILFLCGLLFIATMKRNADDAPEQISQT